jgi:iron(III) transport system ATP-binding protein
VNKSTIREKVSATLDLIGLSGYENRPAPALSGGQQQRVALARALVFEPKILLLDEPLSNLDAKLRVHMRAELKQIQQKTGITSIFVTHDQAESMALADRIIVMNGGKIEQMGSPRDIYESPRSRFVSEFVGTINLMPVSVESVSPPDSLSLNLDWTEGKLRCLVGDHSTYTESQKLFASIRPERFHLLRDRPTNGSNVWDCLITFAAYFGDHWEYSVSVGDREFMVNTNPEIVAQTGERLFLSCLPSDVVIFPRED